MTTISEVIERINEWKGKDIQVKELTEGLTNSNYLITMNQESYVVRIPGHGSDIFIDRNVELHNLKSASEIGVGAHLRYFFESDDVVVVDFIDGETMTIDAFRSNRDAIVRAVEAMKKVHTEAEFISDFVMFDKFDDYNEVIKRHNVEIPADYKEGIVYVGKTQNHLRKDMPSLKPCHNDLLAENFIDQGDRMRIIDWEFSGMNDVCFELGDFSVEQGFGEEEDTLIVHTYFGEFDERKFARMNVYKPLADILWAAYGFIQNHFSKLDYDFWEYGSTRLDRAMKVFHSDIFSKYLEIA